MGLLTVNLDACDRDGACVAVCPIGILALDPAGGPHVREGTAPYCLACGHCVAVCPRGALDNVRNPISGQAPLPPGPILDPEKARLFLRARRSIRCYEEKPLPRDLLLQLMHIARHAPSGHNSQGISYLIVEGREAIESVCRLVLAWMDQTIREQPEFARRNHMPGIVKAWERGEDRILRHAPQLIVAHAPRENRAAPVSTALALEYVELFAPTLGLGTCWAGFAQVCAQQYPKLPAYLAIPEQSGVTGMLMVGYPKIPYHRVPSRNPLDIKWFSS
jgi:nitroreductase/NAD-dependent dihydropyrimidine dehydrogenase PreA subunit